MYWFLDKNDNVLYVGKAKNLKKRITSYRRVRQLSERIHQMVLTASTVKWSIASSELEALLIEAELIRLHQPPFNVLLKDDKSSLYIHITQEKYPRIVTVRKREIIRNNLPGTVLGPFPSAYKTREVLKLVRPIFKWCNQKNKGNIPCFYFHIDQCSGACIGKIDQKEYQESIKLLKTFLKGKKNQVVRQYKKKLLSAANTQKFEKAATIRDKLQLIEQVTSSQKRLKPNLTLPSLHLRKTKEKLLHLKRILADYSVLPKEYPLQRIEGYDVSNIQGNHPAVAMVTFINGTSDTKEYRLFNIRSLNTPNDYAMLKEALVRRQKHPEWSLPNLIVIDGGKGQLRTAISVWETNTPIISIAKNPDRVIIPYTEKINKKQNLKYHILRLDQHNPALQLLQQIRDEAHRFSKKQHTRLRNKALFQ